jgi:hypothetical protein
MTREEAKLAIAKKCGFNIRSICKGRGYCHFKDSMLALNLLKMKGENARKMTGFFLYSTAQVQGSDATLMGPWLQSMLFQEGFENFVPQAKRLHSETEGHVADFYLPIDWGNLSEENLDKIHELAMDLRAFETNFLSGNSDKLLRTIQKFNETHPKEFKEYLESLNR